MKTLYLFVALMCLGMLAKPAYQFAQEEGQAAACDNSGAKDTTYRNHHCACERTAQDHCDAEGVKSPKSSCKTYCRPSNCDCAGPCVPS